MCMIKLRIRKDLVMLVLYECVIIIIIVSCEYYDNFEILSTRVSGKAVDWTFILNSTSRFTILKRGRLLEYIF